MDAPVGERRFGEVILCDQCGRSTAAGRPTCFYCGHATFAGTLVPQKTILIRAEDWENGFNVIVSPPVSNVGNIGRAAEILNVEPDELSAVLVSKGPVPMFRASNVAAARSLAADLGVIGFNCKTVADTALDLQRVNTRLRTLVIEAGRIHLEDFNTGKVAVFAVSNLRLLVAGTVRETRTETFQKRAMLREAGSADEAEISGDGTVMDLYCDGHETGFQITPAGFDFSCLGSEKGMMARENWAKLIRMLGEELPQLIKDLEYDRLASHLEFAWPLSRRSETEGLVKTGFGKRAFGRTQWMNNAEQFLRYSRLRWHLYEK